MRVQDVEVPREAPVTKVLKCSSYGGVGKMMFSWRKFVRISEKTK
jgi:hypothetical protein